jgi:hypothetical protein
VRAVLAMATLCGGAARSDPASPDRPVPPAHDHSHCTICGGAGFGPFMAATPPALIPRRGWLATNAPIAPALGAPPALTWLAHGPRAPPAIG